MTAGDAAENSGRITIPVGILGLPFHRHTVTSACDHLVGAVRQMQRCVVSTPNLNFLITSVDQAPFRASVLASDLSLADGVPVLWVSRLLGAPLPERVAGSDVFSTLAESGATPPIKAFFFGGEGNAAERACQQLAENAKGMTCVGFLNPGFCSVEAMSRPEHLDAINAAAPDFLVLSLGAAKGQAWIQRNVASLQVPAISHLGAVVNFVAGTVKRAPRAWQRLGLEWLWRISEEPALWRRYASDGYRFLGILLSCILPYAWWLTRNKPLASAQDASVSCDQVDGESMRISLSGALTRETASQLHTRLHPHLCGVRHISLEMTHVSYIDPVGMGLILLLEQHVLHAGGNMKINSYNCDLGRVLQWNCMQHLLA